MKGLIPLIPALPLISFLLIALFGKLMPRKAVAFLGVGSVSASAVITIITGILFLSAPSSQVTVTLYRWISTGGFNADVSLVLDPLSLVFCFVITFVGALIHL